MWNQASHAFTDYAWRMHEALPVTAAALFPLFFRVANQHQAESEAQTVRRKLLMPGGIATTLVVSGQQWDQPNGWAPLQWIAVVGLRNYNEAQLAEAIAKRWSCENSDYYQKSRILVEKYNLVSGRPGGGGEYAVQIGFGWTNGVLRALASLYPNLSRLSPELCVTGRQGQRQEAGQLLAHHGSQAAHIRRTRRSREPRHHRTRAPLRRALTPLRPVLGHAIIRR
jgi:alpha,alpha-trehalase